MSQFSLVFQLRSLYDLTMYNGIKLCTCVCLCSCMHMCSLHNQIISLLIQQLCLTNLLHFFTHTYPCYSIHHNRYTIIEFSLKFDLLTSFKNNAQKFKKLSLEIEYSIQLIVDQHATYIKKWKLKVTLCLVLD